MKAREKDPNKESILTKIKKTIAHGGFPTEIARTYTLLYLIAGLLLLAGVIAIFLPNIRGIAPLCLLVALVCLIFGFYRKYEIVNIGVTAYRFYTKDYTYLTKFTQKPTGVVIISEDEKTRGKIFHLTIPVKQEIPVLDAHIILFVPNDAVINEQNGRKFFSRVLTYRYVCD